MVVKDILNPTTTFLSCSTAYFHMVVKAAEINDNWVLCCSTAYFHMVVKVTEKIDAIALSCSTAYFHMVVKASIEASNASNCCSTAYFHMVVKVELFYYISLLVAVQHILEKKRALYDVGFPAYT